MEMTLANPDLNHILAQQTTQRINWIIEKVRRNCRYIQRDEQLIPYFNDAQTTRTQVLQNINNSLLALQQVKKLLNFRLVSLLAVDKITRYMQVYINRDDLGKGSVLERVNWVFDLQNKFNSLADFLQCLKDFKDDITTLSNKKYVGCWRRVHFNNTGNPQKIQRQLEFLRRMIRMTTAAIISEGRAQSTLGGMVSFGVEFPRSLISYSRTQFLCLSEYRRPTVITTKGVWDLGESGTFYHFQRLVHPLIGTNEQLYLPRNIYKHVNIHLPNADSVKVRLLHHKQLRFSNKQQITCFTPFFQRQKVQDESTVVIYINGGGFIALSSFSMQAYTRKWANQLKVPVFCIDYRKPPEYRFPAPIEDAVDAYRFITQRIHEFVNIRPKKIILTGDSAGGNIACALMGNILKQNLVPVHAMFLAYPAIDTRKIFTPSRLNAFNEPILYPTLLLLCMREYLGDIGLLKDNPYASPILLSEEHCGGKDGDKRWPLKWPKTCIVVGKKDPLYDDALKMMERMVQSNIDCHCEVYNNYSHAFLSMELAVSDCSELVKDSIKFLKGLIQ